MTRFTKRSLAVGETLGEKLRRLREEDRHSLEEVAAELRIAPRYLEALESGRYEELPGEIYTRSFLRSYADYLHVQPARVLELYDHEAKIAVQFPGAHRILPPTAKSLRTFVTTSILGRVIVSGILAAILLYLGLEVYHIVSPPNLEISEPAENLVTRSRTIAVAGQTEPEAMVTINGTEVFVDAQGYFEEVVPLSPGAHTLEIAARRKRSRTAIERRIVLVEEEEAAPDGG